MDRREAMALSGSASYYMQREMAGPGPGILANPRGQFQTNIGSSSIGSTLQVESSFPNPPHGVNVGAPAAVALAEPLRRKRGRPRKYGPEGVVSLGLSPSSPTSARKLTPIQRRGRGRPPGSGRKQQLASLGEWLSGSAGTGFTPHVITIAVGEDITTKIMSFSQQGPRAICILSANGFISTVTLRQPTTSGGTVTYEGRFEILCLSGSFLHTDNGGHWARTGGLSVSLASPDGRVIGGGVGGVLIAASPVQACSPSGKIRGRRPPPGQCNQQNGSDCCVKGKLYTTYKCSPPVTDNTKATLTLNSFQKGGDGGGPSECDNQYHNDDTPVVALSTGWYNGGSRCLNKITISANGRSVDAMVVDECDSTMGCDNDHDYQPPCSNNIVDASKAVWEALGLDGNVGEIDITWTDA